MTLNGPGRSALFLAPLLVLVAGTPPAAAVTVAAFDNGWYYAGGSHTTTNTNILVRYDFNNFFAFDLSAYSGTVSTATLKIYGGNGYFGSTDATEGYGIFDFAGSIDDLLSGAGGVAAYTDLGSGAVYGAVTMASPGYISPMPELSLLLTADAISDINAAIAGADGRFVIGGTGTTLGTSDELWGSSTYTTAAELSLTFSTGGGGDQDSVPVPAPGALPLLAAGLVPLGLMRVRRRTRSDGRIS